MRVPTEDEAVEMFARHFEALHRSGAATKAEEMAAALKKRGDSDGHRVWRKVAERIRHLRRPEQVAHRRSAEAA